MSVWLASACTGLQGGEPHDDDDAASIVPSDDRLYEVPDEGGLGLTDAT
ncbi:MAG TPA: hypothetical protein VMW33_09720 [Ilumatobacteraceae bacterium]|nr:hypothetical protein [Ilumatobacteraceae bacterium]